MKLFKYEMKKILFNKARLILLVLLFALYGFLGFVLAAESEMRNTPQEPEAAVIYAEMIEQHTGPFNQETLRECQEIVKAAVAEYGKGEEMEHQLRINPSLKFATQYVNFGKQVDIYWNGPESQAADNILGVYPIQEKLKELEGANRADSSEYNHYQQRLELERQIGEPVFAKTGIWSAFFLMFDWVFIVFLFLMALTFFISPLFTQEVRTEMDSILLCSLKGRREIVTAKLLAAALTSAILAAGYLGASLIGMMIGSGDFSGWGASARCLEIYAQAPFDLTVGTLVIMSIAWLIFSTVVFGLALAFISCKMKNQSAAFGIGIVVLLAGMMSGSIPKSLYSILWPVVDFHFGALAMFNTIFSGVKTYTIGETPVSYGTMALIVCLVLGILACLLTYLAQKKRSAV
ncbi:ABC transporter permease [Desulfitobacterium hafniense]|uniref:ABC transporter permease n=1 Tax=Desulfitobacterium hafniense TaxID=49338 RepID=UPI00036685C4|nr:ABC transporter permease [Desulfitobacterium hafniense]